MIYLSTVLAIPDVCKYYIIKTDFNFSLILSFKCSFIFVVAYWYQQSNVVCVIYWAIM